MICSRRVRYYNGSYQKLAASLELARQNVNTDRFTSGANHLRYL